MNDNVQQTKHYNIPYLRHAVSCMTVTYNDGITEIVLETENSLSETIGAKELDM